MVRRKRIALALVATLAGLLSGTLAPAAGDQVVSGASAERLSYTEDGVPFVRSGPECKAGHHGGGGQRDQLDASDY